jgi:hypothetical protein
MSAAEDESVNVAREQPPSLVAVSHAGHLLRGVFSLAVEALCPTSKVGWTYYERDPSIYASIARFWQDGLFRTAMSGSSSRPWFS